MSMSDERLAALISRGPPWGRWPGDEVTKALKDIQVARALLVAALQFRQNDELEREIRAFLYPSGSNPEAK